MFSQLSLLVLDCFLWRSVLKGSSTETCKDFYRNKISNPIVSTLMFRVIWVLNYSSERS